MNDYENLFQPMDQVMADGSYQDFYYQVQSTVDKQIAKVLKRSARGARSRTTS